ncbi:type II secretion system minor pseudopilin GspK [Oceanobacter kriegii]|uniref:type II secretion system minor pseudopilin GspK n=1 Tax=Oceanobacter kriegii TaxID=64972 RepID=UPI0003F8A133|nr:type II secretion system minor pseudopilin GspK [Oceanobacter kriegii]
MRRSQQGVALILVLLIFAIVSVLATVLIQRQSADAQRAYSQFSTLQARTMVDGVESVVRSGLRMDWDADPDIDHSLEEWNIDRTFPMDNGMVFVHIADAQGRFNLNWLSPSSTNQAVWQQRFYNLLNDLGLNVEIAQQVANWMNEESQVDNDYLGLEVPYRAAYNLCKHTSDIMLVTDVTAEVYKQLEPYIACLPVDTQLNINTASWAVLTALDTDFDATAAAAVITARGDSGFAAVADFMELEEVKTASTAKDEDSSTRQSSSDSDSTTASNSWAAEDFSVKTQYFEVFAQVGVGEAAEWIATSEFLLKRDASTAAFTTLYRDFSRRKARVTPDVAGT